VDWKELFEYFFAKPKAGMKKIWKINTKQTIALKQTILKKPSVHCDAISNKSGLTVLPNATSEPASTTQDWGGLKIMNKVSHIDRYLLEAQCKQLGVINPQNLTDIELMAEVVFWTAPQSYCFAQHQSADGIQAAYDMLQHPFLSLQHLLHSCTNPFLLSPLPTHPAWML
jgi:hypothetical protein